MELARPQGVSMQNSRRKFIIALWALGVPLGPLGMVGAQAPTSVPKRHPSLTDKDDDPDAPKTGTKTILEANQKDIKKNVERLYQLASELKTEVEKTDSVQVLSLALLKKTEEIEKLAKDIRSRAKG